MKRKEAPSNPHLAERIDQLSIKRQEIIRPILEHPREFVLLSVRAMARRLQTDPATIVRIVRGLFFASYDDVQRHLHDPPLAADAEPEDHPDEPRRQLPHHPA